MLFSALTLLATDDPPPAPITPKPKRGTKRKGGKK